MYTLSQLAQMEAQSLGSDSVFMVLLEIVLLDNTILRFTSNNEDIVWPSPDGDTYVAFPFEIDQIGETRKNEVQKVSIKVGNVTRYVQYYVEQSDGAIGASVQLRVVNSKNLQSDVPEIELPFVITGCTCDSKWVNFVLGAPNQFQSRFPLNRISQNFCRFKFKSIQCGYSGALTTCNKSLADCRLRSNSSRFGGFPGMGSSTALYV